MEKPSYYVYSHIHPCFLWECCFHPILSGHLNNYNDCDHSTENIRARTPTAIIATFGKLTVISNSPSCQLISTGMVTTKWITRSILMSLTTQQNSGFPGHKELASILLLLAFSLYCCSCWSS